MSAVALIIVVIVVMVVCKGSTVRTVTVGMILLTLSITYMWNQWASTRTPPARKGTTSPLFFSPFCFLNIKVLSLFLLVSPIFTSFIYTWNRDLVDRELKASPTMIPNLKFGIMDGFNPTFFSTSNLGLGDLKFEVTLLLPQIWDPIYFIIFYSIIFL